MKNNSIKLGIISDLHQDIMHDARNRLENYINQATKENVDFIIQLGDFCYPIEANKDFLSIWNNYRGVKYHVLGNHDMDNCDKTQAMRYYGMSRSYYYFDCHDFRFVVLDTNYVNINNQYFDYANGNFFKYPNERTNLSTEQLNWLKEVITDTDKYIVLFSHASLQNARYGIRNRLELQKILEDENAKCGYQKVVASFNGHTHIDKHTVINSINYIDINSASNQWLGENYKTIRYSEELCESYPAMQYVVPYKESLFAIVTLNPDGVLSVKGNQSDFVGTSPNEMGYNFNEVGYEITPSISSRMISFKAK